MFWQGLQGRTERKIKFYSLRLKQHAVIPLTVLETDVHVFGIVSGPCVLENDTTARKREQLLYLNLPPKASVLCPTFTDS